MNGLTWFLIGLTILNIGVLCTMNWKDHNWWGNYQDESKSSHRWNRHDLMVLDGFQFEDWCAEVFKRGGYVVEQTSYRADGGKDLILKDNQGNVTYVECKRYENEMIGRELCQKLIGACVGNGIKRALFITTSSFHQNANDYMCDVNRNSDITMDFMDCDEILRYANMVYGAEVENIEDTVVLNIKG